MTGKRTANDAGPAAAPAEDVAAWAARFDAWVDGHPPRVPLPDSAFDRASFYGGGL